MAYNLDRDKIFEADWNLTTDLPKMTFEARFNSDRLFVSISDAMCYINTVVFYQPCMLFKNIKGLDEAVLSIMYYLGEKVKNLSFYESSIDSLPEKEPVNMTTDYDTVRLDSKSIYEATNKSPILQELEEHDDSNSQVKDTLNYELLIIDEFITKMANANIDSDIINLMIVIHLYVKSLNSVYNSNPHDKAKFDAEMITLYYFSLSNLYRKYTHKKDVAEAYRSMIKKRFLDNLDPDAVLNVYSKIYDTFRKKFEWTPGSNEWENEEDGNLIGGIPPMRYIK